MDRKSFLSSLRTRLWWRLPPEELASVLGDYNEYFDSGIAEGKTEQELCLQFGSPRDIVRELEGSMGKHHVKLPLIITLASFALVAFLYFGAMHGGYPLQNFLINLYSNEIFAVVTAAAVLVSAVYCGNCMVRKPSPIINAVIYVSSLLSFLLMLTTNWLLGVQVVDIFFFFEGYMPPQNIGPFMSAIFAVQVTLGLLSWLAIVVFRSSLHRFTPVLLAGNAMTVCTAFGMCIILLNMDDPNSLFGAVNYAKTIGMLLLLLAVPILLILGRKEKLWTAR